MEEIELEFINIDSPQPQNEVFKLTLKEKNGNRFITVIIGLSEAKTIIMETHHIKLKRPCAHDLFIQLCKETECTIQKVVISNYEDGIYEVKIELLKNEIPINIDSRISDAAIIAIKENIPIYIMKDVFAEICQINNSQDDSQITDSKWNVCQDEYDDVDYFTIDDDDKINDSEPPTDLEEVDISDLEIMLKNAIEVEDFELAAQIDAEINKRNALEK